MNGMWWLEKDEKTYPFTGSICYNSGFQPEVFMYAT